MFIRSSSTLGALLLTLVLLVLASDVSAAPADTPGNSANAKACQKGGWQVLHTSTGEPFTSEEECTSYGAHGGIIVAGPILVVDATIGFCGGPDPYCWGAFTGS